MTLWDGRKVPRIGVGCWAIGGRTTAGNVATSYGDVDDARSLAGLRLAGELGARLFDTAAYYGGGHSEQLLGQAFGARQDIVLVTKVGAPVDPGTRETGPLDLSPEAIRASVDRSRRNLRRDRLDLLLFHINDCPPAEAAPVFDTFGQLRDEGKIAAFGWSTDFVASARVFAERPGFVAVENDFNVFDRNPELMDYAQAAGLVSINRVPLAMGLLTGKYSAGLHVGAGDVRGEPLPWMKFFKQGVANPDYAARLEAIREVLTTGGRSLAQGALGWILAKAPNALPVPGFKTPEQIRDNLGALEKGPLPAGAMDQIDVLLGV